MKIVIAMDSFKGSLDSINCGNAIKRGIMKAIPDSEIEVFPLADGGEGMVHVLSNALKADWIPCTVTGPLMKKVNAGYGYIEQNSTAILEMASASGLALLTPNDYNPMAATTIGVGELIIHALERGCRNFIVGIGGSATNDGGVGMLKALGYHFLDSKGKDVGNGADALSRIHHIDSSHIFPELMDCTFQVACDVNNPLCGKNGATYIYGPQKGLQNNQLEAIDLSMNHYADIASYATGKDVASFPGTGAAGGLGFAFLNFLNAKLVPGAQLIIDSIGLENEIVNADIIITGEGRLDSQTVLGKAPISIAKLAKKHNKKSNCLFRLSWLWCTLM